MTIWIYKCVEKVSIIERITNLYLILHTELHIEISLLWSKLDKYYNNKIRKKNFFEYLETFMWQFQYISVNKRFDFFFKWKNVFYYYICQFCFIPKDSQCVISFAK